MTFVKYNFTYITDRFSAYETNIQVLPKHYINVLIHKYTHQTAPDPEVTSNSR